MEIAEGANGRNNVSWLEAEYVTGADPGSTILPWRRRRNAHVEAQHAIPLLVAGQRVVVTPAGLGISRHQIEYVLMLPHGRERLGNVEITKANRIVSGNIQLQVIARRERNLFCAVQGFENQLLDKCGDVTVTDHAELVSLLRASPGAPGPAHVNEDSTVALGNGVRDQAAADRHTRGRPVDKVEAPIMLGALDEISLYQAEGKMNIAVGAQSVARVKLAIFGAIESVGLLAVVEADDISEA